MWAGEDKHTATQLVVFGWRARASSIDAESPTGGRGIKYNKAAVVEQRLRPEGISLSASQNTSTDLLEAVTVLNHVHLYLIF